MKSVKINAVLNTILTTSNMIVSLVTVPYVTRVLSVDGYGNVTFAQSISSWLSTLCLAGVGTYGIRECARARDDPFALATTVKELLIIVTVCTGTVLGAFAVAIGLVPRLAELAPLMWIFLVSTLLLSYGVEWYYQAIEEYEYITARSVLFKAASLVLTFLLVRNSGDYIVYGAILALVTCGNNLLNLVRLVRTLDWGAAKKVRVGRHIRPLLSFAALSISSSVYLNLDSVILGMVSNSNYEVGLYQLAVKLKGVMWSVLNAVLGVLIPRLSNLVGSGRMTEYRALLGKGSALTVDVCTALAGYFAIFAGPIAVLVSGEDFAGAAPAIRIIGVVNLFSCLSYLIGLCVLTPLGRERDLAVGNLVGVPVSLVLNLVLDPVLGSVGAALSILCAEAVIFAVQLWKAKDYSMELFGVRNVAKVIVGNAAAVAVSLVALGMVDGMPADTGIVLSLLVYFGPLLVVLAALREDGAREVIAILAGLLGRG